MKQSAAVRPDPTYFRKAAIAHGAALDHRGAIAIAPIPGFRLDQTIFKTLASPIARYVARKRVGKEVYWRRADAEQVQRAYEAAREAHPLPEIAPELLRFLVEECDFDVEHADGSFLDHLYFCFEYAVHHGPEGSPLVMFLHSVLGTGTNTFAMTADKIPAFRALVPENVYRHVEAFPSVLRLLYTDLLAHLEAKQHCPDDLKEVRMHRVIDDATIVLEGAELWKALNFQLMHLVDFLPPANWAAHQSDHNFILFRRLHRLLSDAGKLEADVDYTPAPTGQRRAGEVLSPGTFLVSHIPVRASWVMTCRAIAQFSADCGHSLDFALTWR